VVDVIARLVFAIVIGLVVLTIAYAKFTRD
jgi:hypothetical protein